MQANRDRGWLRSRWSVVLRRRGYETAAAVGLLVATDVQEVRANSLDDSVDDRLAHATHQRRVQP